MGFRPYYTIYQFNGKNWDVAGPRGGSAHPLPSQHILQVWSEAEPEKPLAVALDHDIDSKVEKGVNVVPVSIFIGGRQYDLNEEPK